MASPLARPTPKFAPKVALVQLDDATTDTLKRAFAQCGIQTVQVAEDFGARLGREQFQGCVVRLDDQAVAVLEAVRSSRSNRRMILYGVLPDNADLRRFSKYGINAVLDSTLDRSGILKVARSTSALLLNELRLYIRIPLVIEVSMESPGEQVSGSTREISGGGMSVQLTREARISDKQLLSFKLPEKPSLSIGASVCWRKGSLVGFQFHESDPARRVVKDWVNAFLGLG